MVSLSIHFFVELFRTAMTYRLVIRKQQKRKKNWFETKKLGYSILWNEIRLRMKRFKGVLVTSLYLLQENALWFSYPSIFLAVFLRNSNTTKRYTTLHAYNFSCENWLVTQIWAGRVLGLSWPGIGDSVLQHNFTLQFPLCFLPHFEANIYHSHVCKRLSVYCNIKCIKEVSHSANILWVINSPAWYRRRKGSK